MGIRGKHTGGGLSTGLWKHSATKHKQLNPQCPRTLRLERHWNGGKSCTLFRTRFALSRRPGCAYLFPLQLQLAALTFTRWQTQFKKTMRTTCGAHQRRWETAPIVLHDSQLQATVLHSKPLSCRLRLRLAQSAYVFTCLRVSALVGANACNVRPGASLVVTYAVHIRLQTTHPVLRWL